MSAAAVRKKPRRDATGDTARTSLLRATEAVIVRDGLLAVTTRQVAAEAGVSVSLIGYHFGGVDNLIAEVMRVNLDGIIAAQQRYASAADPSSLSSILTAYLRPLWAAAAFTPTERASVVVQEIYRRAAPALQAQADARLEEGFLPLLRLMKPHLPHLDQSELIWRICAIAGTVLSVSEGAPSWRLFQAIKAATHTGTRSASLQRMVAYARAVLMAPHPLERTP